MATGVAAPGAIMLTDTVGVVDLQNAALPLPTDEALSLAGLSASTVLGTIADPRPDFLELDGLPGHTHDLVFHNCIHIFPRRSDLGAVISEQEIEAEVWNAFMNRARTLEEITVEGPAGIVVVDHLGVPADFPASDSQIFAVTVEAEGDPQINNTITWVFTGIEEAGCTLTIVGFRLIMFPFDPNMAHPITETFGYRTDIIEAFNGKEQRIQLRAVPIGSISYNVALIDRRDAQMAAAILFGNQARAFGVGRWQFQTTLTTGAIPAETTIYLDTTDIPFEVGGLVMLWADPYTWEVQPIESIGADHLVLATELQHPWGPIHTKVLPVVVGRLSKNERLTYEALAISSQTLRFKVDGFRP